MFLTACPRRTEGNFGEMFPWLFGTVHKSTAPRDVLVDRLREGVPTELAARAAGIDWETIKDDPEVIKATASRKSNEHCVKLAGRNGAPHCTRE